MFGKSKFYSKCKGDIKMIKTRIEMIKRKRKAMQKYLSNDVADLLKNGLDVNAYGRAEGLLVEQIRTSCYEFIEPCCALISTHLSAMDKQKECPEECREAVSSLMFAAARFADLPELRELRTLFSEKYGKSLDCYVNKEFVQKLTSGLPSKDMKLQLLQDIAAESGFEWNSKALENKLYNETAARKEDLTEETNDNNFKNTEELIPPPKKKGYSYYEQKEATEIEEKTPDEVAPPFIKDIQVDTIKKIEKPSFTKNIPKKEEENENEEKPTSKYSLIPPPYTKPEVNEKVGPTDDSAGKAKRVPKSVRRRSLKKPQPNSKPASDDERELKNKEKAAQSRRVLKFFDGGGDKDEEESMMDKLLHYYSRKKEPDLKSRDVPNRASSFSPPKVTSPKETSPTKKHNRAASCEPEMWSNKGHVHSKLPDYDDFVARLAAYRGKRSEE